jgi:hypothetical protein
MTDNKDPATSSSEQLLPPTRQQPGLADANDKRVDPSDHDREHEAGDTDLGDPANDEPQAHPS